MAAQPIVDPYDLGSNLELFLDDRLLTEMRGVTLKLHSPVLRDVALELNRPWEGPSSYDPVVMLDEGRYRLWYRGCGPVWEDQVTAYAQSTDGIHWQRPSLGIHEFAGTTDNNIVLRGREAKALSVFRDENPAAPAAERYKAIGLGPKQGPRAILRGFTSPDGLHWQPLQPDPLVVAPDDARPWFDSHNVALWDPLQSHYVIYARGWLASGERAIRRTISPDFRTWSDFTFIDMGDAPTEHLYKNACTQYFRAPHFYLMFPKRFVPQRRFHADWPDPGLSESVFMSSRDGLHWDRRFMEAFLRPGPDPENWTDRNMYIGVGVVPTGPAELSLYVLEHYKHPSVRLRRATLRTDGFVSVNAPYAGGEFVTHPLTFDGGRLTLNVATSVAGGVRVELQEVNGQPVAGYALADCDLIYGDEIERTVTWQGRRDLRALAGRPLRLRVALHDADLYALQFQAE